MLVYILHTKYNFKYNHITFYILTGVVMVEIKCSKCCKMYHSVSGTTTQCIDCRELLEPVTQKRRKLRKLTDVTNKQVKKPAKKPSRKKRGIMSVAKSSGKTSSPRECSSDTKRASAPTLKKRKGSHSSPKPAPVMTEGPDTPR